MSEVTPALPPSVSLILTRPLPCGLLIAFIFSAQLWLPQIFASLPLVVFLLLFICMGLNFFTPALTAIVSLGGGIQYTAQAGAIATLLLLLLPGISWMIALVFALLYVALPAIAVSALTTNQGISRSSDILVLGVAAGVVLGLIVASLTLQSDIQPWISAFTREVFMKAQPKAIPAEMVDSVYNMLAWSITGMLAFSVWLVWGLNLKVARDLATRYGFYDGDPRSLLELRPGRWIGGAFLVALAFANLMGGDIQYLGVTLAILFAGIIATNGVSLVHLFLRSRGMGMTIMFMYVMLLIEIRVIVPFVLLGLLDIWFDYRRKITNASS